MLSSGQYAADQRETIRRLEEEVARLTSEHEQYRLRHGECLVRAEAAEGLVGKYRDILTSIANNTCCDHCQEAALVAQRALTSTLATRKSDAPQV